MIDGLPAFVGNCVRAMLRKGGAVCCGCCMGAECWVYLQGGCCVLWVLHGCRMLGIFAIIADM